MRAEWRTVGFTVWAFLEMLGGRGGDGCHPGGTHWLLQGEKQASALCSSVGGVSNSCNPITGKVLCSVLEGFVLCCLARADGRMLPHLACADGLSLGQLFVALSFPQML